MFSDENKISSLAKLISQFDYVIVDTCSLMDDNFPTWMDNLERAQDYLREDLMIYVPKSCADELKKHSKDQKLDSKRIAAVRALKILKEAKKRKILSEFKTTNSNFADNVIYTKVSEDRIHSRILVITQDKALASDLKRLNYLNSQKGNKVAVYKISYEGRLDVNKGEDSPVKAKPDTKKARIKKAKEEKPSQKASKKIDQGELIAKAIAFDKTLRANITNPNYPLEKKTADVKAQLQNLSKIPAEKRKTLALAFPEIRLKESLIALEKGQPIPTFKSVSSAKKEEPKESPKAEEAPKKLWYGTGNRLDVALFDCASHYGIIFHDPAIEYFPPVHGPLDLTTSDAAAVIGELLPKVKLGKATIVRDLVSYSGEKADHSSYKVWIDFDEALEAKEAEKASKTAKKAKKTSAKKAKKEEKEEPAAKKKAKAPKEPKTKKAKAESKAPKAPKKEKKAKQEPAKPNLLEQAKAGERRLKAVLHNPNYSQDNKMKDIAAQLELVKKLSKEERQQLEFGVDALALMASLNK